MSCNVCTVVASDVTQGDEDRAFEEHHRIAGFLAGVDMALDWVTEKLDRKFVTAMQRCHNESPDRKREINLLKRIVLVLICVALAVSTLP